MAKAKRIKTRYPGIYRVGDRYEWRTRTARGMADTLKEARGAKATAEARGPIPAAMRGPFGEHALDWLAGYQGRTSRGFSEPSRRRYRESLTLYAIPYFDEVRKLKPAQIQRRHVKAFIAWLATAPEHPGESGAGRRPLARATVERTLAPLRAMFADAVDDDLLPTNPASVRINLAVETVNPEVGDGKARPFTEAQLAAVLAVVPERETLMFDTVEATGPRWGELCELRGRDLVMVGGRPHLRIQRAYTDKVKDQHGRRGVVKLPKTSFGRRDLPLTPELARRLWRLQRGPNEFLFTAPMGGRMDYSGIRRRVLVPVLRAASAAEGADDVTWAGWHTFRHSIASRLFAEGRNVKQVQRWLGHHKASFTLDTYVHLMGDEIGGPLAPASATAELHGGQRGANRDAETSGNVNAAPDAKTGDLQA